MCTLAMTYRRTCSGQQYPFCVGGDSHLQIFQSALPDLVFEYQWSNEQYKEFSLIVLEILVIMETHFKVTDKYLDTFNYFGDLLSYI